MTAEPWFDPNVAGLAGAIMGTAGGVWGGAVGVAGGLLVPKGKGKGLVFGLLWLGVAAGAACGGLGLAALLAGQPYELWYSFLLPGVLLLGLSVPFLFVMRNRYRQVELRRMQAEELD